MGYLDIFRAKTQMKISKYPMLAPKNVENMNHFGVKPIISDTTEEFKEAMLITANLLKSTGKNVWNQAKDKYKQEKNELLKKKYPQIARIKSEPKVTNNPLFQQNAQQSQQQAKYGQYNNQQIGNAQYVTQLKQTQSGGLY